MVEGIETDDLRYTPHFSIARNGTFVYVPAPTETASHERRNGLSSLPPPDGRYFAYVSNRTGRGEVYVREFLWGNLNKGWREQVSSEGGTEPRWSRDGKKLFYHSPSGMMEVAVESRPDSTIELSESELLFDDSAFQWSFFNKGYDVSSDGRFLMIKKSPPTQINVIQNWFEELKRLAPTVKK